MKSGPGGSDTVPQIDPGWVPWLGLDLGYPGPRWLDVRAVRRTILGGRIREGPSVVSIVVAAVGGTRSLMDFAQLWHTPASPKNYGYDCLQDLSP